MKVGAATSHAIGATMEGLVEPLPRGPMPSAQGETYSPAAVTSTKVEIEQHSLVRSIALHLLPGAALFAFVIAAAALGIEPFGALIAGIVLVIVPIELGYLLVQAKRTTGRWSVLAIVGYRERMTNRELVRSALPLVLWFLAMLFVSIALLDAPIAKALFSWYPESIREFASPEDGGTTPTWVMIGFFAAAFAINGVIGPVVEELYFRGYLLPVSPAMAARRRCSTPRSSPSITSGPPGRTQDASLGCCPGS